jgi:hypothetical protein
MDGSEPSGPDEMVALLLVARRQRWTPCKLQRA